MHVPFYLQGDRELEMGLPISPLCDRSVTCIPESQLGTQCMQRKSYLVSEILSLKTKENDRFFTRALDVLGGRPDFLCLILILLRNFRSLKTFRKSTYL